MLHWGGDVASGAFQPLPQKISLVFIAQCWQVCHCLCPLRGSVSGVPPFILHKVLEKELSRFGKFFSGFKTVPLGCKDDCLQHVQSLRQQAFIYLSDQSGVLDVTFKVKFENGFYTIYASSGSMKCFECGDAGHKCATCPHKEQATVDVPDEQ